jgi:hypothetical protein
MFNCSASYPLFPELRTDSSFKIPIASCRDTATRGNYVDDLMADFAPASIATTTSGWTKIQGGECNAPTVPKVYSGNVLVNCSNYSVGNGSDVRFTGGNVVFTGDLKMTGGVVSINTANPAANLTGACLTPGTGSACPNQSSANAAFVHFTSGGFNFTGGALNLNHTAVIMNPTGSIKMTAGVPIAWNPPSEGPFTQLSLWAESKDSFSLNGGGNLNLQGVFFTPEGDMTIAGGSALANPLDAQFISYRLTISGNADFRLGPNPNTAVYVPPLVSQLIR